MTAIRKFAYVRNDTAPPVQGHAIGTPALVRPRQIHAVVGTLMRVTRALVHFLARPLVLSDLIPCRTRAAVAAFLVHALVRASVRLLRTLIHIGAVKLGIFSDLEAVRTRADEAAVQVDAGVRAGLSSTFVDVLASRSVR